MAKIGVSLVSLPSKPSLALAMHIGKHSHSEEAGGIKGILNDTLQVFCSVRLEHETRVKYETCSWSNTDA